MDSGTLPFPQWLWLRASLAGPLPEAKSATGTAWRCSKAQTRTCSSWACDQCGYDGLYPALLQMKARSVSDHVATISRLLQYLLRHSFESRSGTSRNDTS